MANINPVQKYKPNDPYYYEVDNIPIEQLEQNVVSVNDELIDFQSTVQTNYATNSFVGNEIAAQYNTTQTWVSNNYYDSADLFSDYFGAASYGVPKVYTKDQIDTKSNLATDSVLNVFFREAILPTNIDLTSFWNGGSAHILDQYVTVANIGAAATLTQNQVDAIQTRPYDTGGPGLSTTNALVSKGDLQIEIPDISRQALRAAGAASDPPSTTNAYATRNFVNNVVGATAYTIVAPFGIGNGLNAIDNPWNVVYVDYGNHLNHSTEQLWFLPTGHPIPAEAEYLYMRISTWAQGDDNNHSARTTIKIFDSRLVQGTFTVVWDQETYAPRTNDTIYKDVENWICPLHRNAAGDPYIIIKINVQGDITVNGQTESKAGITIMGWF